MLACAGVDFEAVPARIDEAEIKASLAAEGAAGIDIAVAAVEAGDALGDPWLRQGA